MSLRINEQVQSTQPKMKTNNPRSPKGTHEDGGNGHGHRTGNGNGGSSRPHAGPIKRAAGPFYGSGVRFDSGVRYADPSVPESDGAKVKLDLAALNDDGMASFGEEHKSKMAGNPLYPAPTPSTVDFDAILAQYEAALTASDSARTAALEATAAKNAARAALSNALNQRANYVQTASNGNTAAILSSGLPVKKVRTPKGALPAPQNLRITLGNVQGAMTVQWNAVSGNQGYLIRCAKDTPVRDWSQLKRSSKPKLDLQDLEVGTTYVFQVSTAGGDTGQSPWSPEVMRTAA